MVQPLNPSSLEYYLLITCGIGKKRIMIIIFKRLIHMPGLSHKVCVVLSPCFATCWSQYYYWYQLEIISSFGCCARHENIIIMLCLCLSYLIFGTSHLQEKGRHHLVWTQWNERLRTENGDSILLLILRVWLRLAPLETQLVNPGHDLHACPTLHWLKLTQIVINHCTEKYRIIFLNKQIRENKSQLFPTVL